MSSLSRKIKRHQGDPQLSEEQKRLPSGKVVTTPMKGTFLTLPLLGWCAIRQDEVPLIMLGLALLRDDQIRGVLHVELPIYKGETDVATLAALQRYGWNGKVWSMGDEHWPTGDEDNESSLISMMETTGLVASLTFPPDPETGNVNAQEVEVMRARGNFLMQPLPEPEGAVDAEALKTLHDLCDNVGKFYPLN